MSKDRFTECSFLIPVCRDAGLSDGELHAPYAYDWLTDQLYVQFGGATVAPGEYEGFYRDPDTGTQVFDKSHKYVVAVSQENLDQLRRLLSEACAVFM